MVPGMRPKGPGQLVWCLYFLGFFYPGEALPPAAGMDGWHGWGVVKFELLSPLWWSCPKVLGSAGTSPSSGRGHEAGEGSSCGQM